MTHVAWVPDDDPQRDWGIAARLAAASVDARCSVEGATGVLVTNTMDHLGVEALDQFERRHTRTSRRAGRHRIGSGLGPVLSYVPQERELEFAMHLARSSSLAVVETVSLPLLWWASWFEAWDLVRESQTPPLPEAVRDAVERLAFYGNSGFGDDFGRKRAESILSGLDDSARQNGVLLPGAVIAAGVSARGAGNLLRLMENLHFIVGADSQWSPT